MHVPRRMIAFPGDEDIATPANLTHGVVLPSEVSLVKHDGRQPYHGLPPPTSKPSSTATSHDRPTLADVHLSNKSIVVPELQSVTATTAQPSFINKDSRPLFLSPTCCEGQSLDPGFDDVFGLSTHHQRFTCVRLLDSYLTEYVPPFPATLTTTTLDRRRLPRFEVCACTPTSRPPLILGEASPPSLHRWLRS